MRCIDVENYPGFETIKSAPLEYAIGKAFKEAEAKTEAYEQDKVAQAVDRLKTEGADSDAGVTFNEDGTVYEGPGYLIPINENETTTVALSVNNIKRLIKRYGNKGPYVKVHIKKHARDPNKPYQPDKVTVSYNVIVPKDKAHLAQIIAKVAGRKYLINTEGSLAINVENPRKGITKRLALSGARLKDLQASLTAGELPKFIVDEYNKMGLDHHINKYGQKIAKPEPKPKAKSKPKPKPQPKPKEKPKAKPETKPEVEPTPDEGPINLNTGNSVFDNLINDNIVDKAKRVIMKIGLPLIQPAKKNRASFTPGEIAINIPKRLSNPAEILSSLIHEYGHYLDFNRSVPEGTNPWTEEKNSRLSFAKKAKLVFTFSGKLKAAFVKDSERNGMTWNGHTKFKDSKDAFNKGADLEIVDKYTLREDKIAKLVSVLSKALRLKKQEGDITWRAVGGYLDIMDAMAHGRMHTQYGTYGHGVTYFKQEHLRYMEVFANLFQLWSLKDRQLWDSMSNIMPETTKQFEILMEEILND